MKFEFSISASAINCASVSEIRDQLVLNLVNQDALETHYVLFEFPFKRISPDIL